MSNEQVGDWGAAGMMVMRMLEDHGKLLKEIRDEQINSQVEIGIIKTKLALIGVVSGAISGTATAIIVAIVTAMRG